MLLCFHVMFNGQGQFLYYPSWWLIVKVNDEICEYYRNLIHIQNRSLRLNPSKHGAHITVIAGKHEKPDASYQHLWGKYEGNIIEFSYNREIQSNGQYFWLNVVCPKFEEIRSELGLNPTIPIPWHLTVGNTIEEKQFVEASSNGLG